MAQGPGAIAWRHVASGSEYIQIGLAELKDAGDKGIKEGAVLVVYLAEDGTLWAREKSEFMDGRFVPVEDHTQ